MTDQVSRQDLFHHPPSPVAWFNMMSRLYLTDTDLKSCCRIEYIIPSHLVMSKEALPPENIHRFQG
jgi:hypothetical protein